MPEEKNEEKAPSVMPKTPWKKGINEDYTAFSVQVDICSAKGNRLYALHRMLQQDIKIAATLPTHGEEQVAWALSQEALRRELWISTLIALTGDPSYLKTFEAASEDEKTKILRDLSNKCLNSMITRMSKECMGLAREVLMSIERKQ